MGFFVDFIYNLFLFIINLAGQQLYSAYMDEERNSKAEKGREGATLCFAY
jgi:hypothetical protein